jgi:hypothetical protein
VSGSREAVWEHRRTEGFFRIAMLRQASVFLGRTIVVIEKTTSTQTTRRRSPSRPAPERQPS